MSYMPWYNLLCNPVDQAMISPAESVVGGFFCTVDDIWRDRKNYKTAFKSEIRRENEKKYFALIVLLKLIFNIKKTVWLCWFNNHKNKKTITKFVRYLPTASTQFTLKFVHAQHSELPSSLFQWRVDKGSTIASDMAHTRSLVIFNKFQFW